MLLKNWLSRNKTTLCKTSGSWAGGFLPALLLLCYCNLAKAQVNLVQNPSFEDISVCPAFYNSITAAIGWDTLKNGGGGGLIFNACANPNTNFGVPINTYGLSFQYAKTGVSYAELAFFVNPVFFQQRQYIQTKLLQPLIVGKTYCVTFYTSLNARSQYAVDELSAYFDDGSISTPPLGIFITNPQVKSPTGIFYSHTLNWMKVQGSFTSNGAYTYLTLGNFRSNANTNKILVNSNNQELAEYYIDDVSVIEVNTPAYAGPDTTICRTDSAYIGRPNEIGLECEWFANQQPIGSGTGIWVKPDNTTSYVVKQDICGHISYDTVTVFVKDEDCYATDFEVPNVFSPNEDGVNDAWHFEVKKGSDIRYTIYNRWGNLMKTSAVSGQTVVTWDGRTTAGEACPAGTYYYVLNYTNGKGEAQKKNGYITLIK